MRLEPEQIKAIKQTVGEIVGKDSEVYLFGSRIDDTQRGGDIDLLVEGREPMDPDTRLNQRIALKSRLYRLLGEQKIDLVIHYPNMPMTAFQKMIKKTAIHL
jgi:predicted nucleotidyltransferase